MPQVDDPRLFAAVDMLGRTGADSVQFRFSDDEQPTVWIVVGLWGDRAEAAAGMGPVTAILRLCEEIVDGGSCTHCGRIAAFEADLVETGPLMDGLLCVTMWDPELSTFRRSCEGD